MQNEQQSVIVDLFHTVSADLALRAEPMYLCSISLSLCCSDAVTDSIVIMMLHSSVRRGSGMLSDDMLTVNVGSFVHSMEFCRITSPLEKRRPTTAVRYRRIVTHDVVIMTGHSNGRIRAWDAKTGEKCLVVVVVQYSEFCLFMFFIITFSCVETDIHVCVNNLSKVVVLQLSCSLSVQC